MAESIYDKVGKLIGLVKYINSDENKKIFDDELFLKLTSSCII